MAPGPALSILQDDYLQMAASLEGMGGCKGKG